MMPTDFNEDTFKLLLLNQVFQNKYIYLNREHIFRIKKDELLIGILNV